MLNQFCSCGLDVELAAPFLLHCPTYIIETLALLSPVEDNDNNLLDLYEPVLIRNLLFSSDSFDTDDNTNVLNSTIQYILSTKRFDDSVFKGKQKIFKQCYESVHSVVIVVTCIICKFSLYFLRICFIPGYPYHFWYMVIFFFNFSVYDIISIKKKQKQTYWYGLLQSLITGDLGQRCKIHSFLSNFSTSSKPFTLQV